MFKHLHGRGEDTPSPFAPKSLTETPPRTWRRPTALRQTTSRIGNTSTDVEKTRMPCCLFEPSQKHLHGRGEDHTVNQVGQRVFGNTSTDVEKT